MNDGIKIEKQDPENFNGFLELSEEEIRQMAEDNSRSNETEKRSIGKWEAIRDIGCAVIAGIVILLIFLGWPF